MKTTPLLAMLPTLVMFPTLLFACEMYSTDTPNESVMFHSPDSLCFSLIAGIDYNVEKGEAHYDLSRQESESDPDYWSDWVLKTETNPLITQSLSTSHFGIGIWVPHELETQLDYMETEAWILSHGLQFSLGIGERNSGQPRMRLDYRWHETYDGDVMMQIELPF